LRSGLFQNAALSSRGKLAVSLALDPRYTAHVLIRPKEDMLWPMLLW